MSAADDERVYGEALRRRSRIVQDTAAEVRRILEEAERRILGILDGQPSESERWRLSTVLAEVRRVLEEIAREAGTVASITGTRMTTEGVQLVDTGLSVVRLSPPPMIDSPLLMAMREFMTSKIEGITLELVDAINTRLALVVTGALDRNTARREIAQRLGMTMRRAQTVLYNETARVYANAARLRMEQVEADYPGVMRKKWIRSKGRAEPRVNHRVIHGQVREIGKPFDLTTEKGGALKMMSPHDPAAPIGETINCGCVMVMVPADDSPYARYWKELSDDPADEATDMRLRYATRLEIVEEVRK